MSRDFRSKRDGWFVAVVWLACGLLVGTAWLPLAADDLGWSQLLLVLVQVGAAAFMLWVLYGTSYRIGERDLSVRSGPFRWRIPLDAIVSVEPTRNPLSSPACSLDRLRIVQRTGARERKIMISPTEKSEFLDALALGCPQLVRSPDGLAPLGLPLP